MIMKKFFLGFCLLFLSVLNLSAQLNEGYIKFDVRFEDEGLSDEEKAMLPTMSELWFSNGQMLMRMPTAMGIETNILVREDELFIMMNMLGNKMAIKSERDEMHAKSKNKSSFKLKEITAEKKMIAGYECRKAVMTGEDGEEAIVWFTDKLQVKGAWYYNMEGIDGFPMEFSTSANGLKIKMIAIEVKAIKPAADKFKVPEEYKIMSQEEMQQMFGGMK